LRLARIFFGCFAADSRFENVLYGLFGIKS